MNSLGQRLQWVRRFFSNPDSQTSIRALGRELYPDDDRKARNLAVSWAAWERDKNQPRARELADLLSRLKGLGALDPADVAAWVFSGRGPQPQAPSALASQPEVRDPSRDPVLARPAEPLTIDAERALRKAAEALDQGGDPAPIIRAAVQAIDSLRRAKQLGLAGLVVAVLVGGARPAKAADLRVATGQENQLFRRRRPFRVRRGGAA